MGRGRSGTPRGARRRDFGALRGPLLAGWLFADLFLVLFIVAFASQPAAPKPPLIHKPTPTPTASKSAAPIKPPPMGLEPSPVDFKVKVSPADVDNPATHAKAVAALLSSLHTELAAQHLLSGRSGFVLIFATSATGDGGQINEAISVANSIIPILKTQDGAIFGQTSGEGLWGGAGSGEYFHFQIFFFT